MFLRFINVYKDLECLLGNDTPVRLVFYIPVLFHMVYEQIVDNS